MATQSAIPALSRYYYRVPLSENAVDAYEQQADLRGVPIEELLAERLEKSITFTASKPLYFDDEQRGKLEQLLGRNMHGTTETLAHIAKALIVSVDKVKIHLKPDLLGRLKSRCIGEEYPVWLARIVRVSLEQFAGMR